jgi:hypothetical protein
VIGPSPAQPQFHYRGILGTANQVGEVESMTRAPDAGYRAELYLVYLMPAS